jgi:hypothetical protein
MPFAQAGDVKLHYETFGQGIPFLFVSGTGWPGEPWKLYQDPSLPSVHGFEIWSVFLAE